jgi:hypothetical protein
MCFDFLYKFCLKHFSFYEEMGEIWSEMFISLHVKYPLCLSDFNETWLFSTDFQKHSNIKFHENPSSGSRVVPCGRTDRRTDMTHLIAAFRNLANAPKNLVIVAHLQYGVTQRGNSSGTAPLLVGRLHRLRNHASGVRRHRSVSWLQLEVGTWQEKQTDTEWISRILDGRWSDECGPCGNIHAGRVSRANGPLYAYHA